MYKKIIFQDNEISKVMYKQDMVYQNLSIEEKYDHLPNLLTNGFFENGAVDWVTQTGTPIYENNTLIINGTVSIYQVGVIALNTVACVLLKGNGNIRVRAGATSKDYQEIDSDSFYWVYFVIDAVGNKNFILETASPSSIIIDKVVYTNQDLI